MSQPRIFITGATGYIGGDILFLISRDHPKWQVSCLVRDSSKASDLVSRYPLVRTVPGSLDSIDIIEEEAAKANIIYHCASSDHRKSALAIARGVSRNKYEQVYWIHTSGAGILTYENFVHNNFEHATMNEKIHDDWDHINELISLPDKALHRHVDKIVLDASRGSGGRVKTAIIAPPAIYGLARGTGNIRSVQVNVAVRIALNNGQALRMGDGNNIWHEVHIRDLSTLYLMLGEQAVLGGGKASWNEDGYYLAENGSFRWGDVIQRIADEGQTKGYLSTNAVRSLNFEEAQKHHKNFPYLCGTTSRGRAMRARLLLGWTPQQKPLMEELPSIISDEASAHGIRYRNKGRTYHELVTSYWSADLKD